MTSFQSIDILLISKPFKTPLAPTTTHGEIPLCNSPLSIDNLVYFCCHCLQSYVNICTKGQKKTGYGFIILGLKVRQTING